LSGHLGPLIGQIMEDETKNLFYSLGYNIIKEQVIYPNIDKVINFIETPSPEPRNQIILKQPFYSPGGIVAASIKKLHCTRGDIIDLKTDIQTAQGSEDLTLQRISGGIIITNKMLTNDFLAETIGDNIYCWDSSRLFFYSAKIMKSKLFSLNGAVRENGIPDQNKYSYLREINTDKDSTVRNICNIAIFIDEHDQSFVYSNDHHTAVMDYIYTTEIKPFIEKFDLNVHSRFEVHVLGKAKPDLVRKAHIKFIQEYTKTPKRIGATFDAELPIFHYGVAPWSILVS